MKLNYLLACGMSAALACTASRALAVEDCPTCILGIWDNEHLTRNYGYSTPGVIKFIYVGLRAPDAVHLFRNVEFSIAGLRPEDGLLVLGVSCNQGAIPSCIGTAASPADTSATSTGIGGLVTSWFDCFGDGQPLISIAFVHVDPAPDRVLQVKRRYPTSNPAWRTPALFACGPTTVPVRASGGCYVLNPTPGHSTPCVLENVAVAIPTWSRVKSLYR